MSSPCNSTLSMCYLLTTPLCHGDDLSMYLHSVQLLLTHHSSLSWWCPLHVTPLCLYVPYSLLLSVMVMTSQCISALRLCSFLTTSLSHGDVLAMCFWSVSMFITQQSSLSWSCPRHVSPLFPCVTYSPLLSVMVMSSPCTSTLSLCSLLTTALYHGDVLAMYLHSFLCSLLTIPLCHGNVLYM